MLLRAQPMLGQCMLNSGHTLILRPDAFKCGSICQYTSRAGSLLRFIWLIVWKDWLNMMEESFCFTIYHTNNNHTDLWWWVIFIFLFFTKNWFCIVDNWKILVLLSWILPHYCDGIHPKNILKLTVNVVFLSTLFNTTPIICKQHVFVKI